MFLRGVSEPSTSFGNGMMAVLVATGASNHSVKFLYKNFGKTIQSDFSWVGGQNCSTRWIWFPKFLEFMQLMVEELFMMQLSLPQALGNALLFRSRSLYKPAWLTKTDPPWKISGGTWERYTRPIGSIGSIGSIGQIRCWGSFGCQDLRRGTTPKIRFVWYHRSKVCECSYFKLGCYVWSVFVGICPCFCLMEASVRQTVDAKWIYRRLKSRTTRNLAQYITV